jgi:hypothetical protein
MKTNPNDPVVQSEKWAEAGNEGLTKREYFAATAMQGFCVDSQVIDAERTAEICVQYADALIEELNK